MNQSTNTEQKQQQQKAENATAGPKKKKVTAAQLRVQKGEREPHIPKVDMPDNGLQISQNSHSDPQ